MFTRSLSVAKSKLLIFGFVFFSVSLICRGPFQLTKPHLMNFKRIKKLLRMMLSFVITLCLLTVFLLFPQMLKHRVNHRAVYGPINHLSN